SPAECIDGVEHLRATCDGKGNCPAPVIKSCDPYACGNSACNEQCSSEGDCAASAECSAEGACVTKATCSDDHTVMSPTGVRTDCSPYKCNHGACVKPCVSVLDCVAPNVCSQGGACIPVSDGSAGQDSGCSFSQGSGQAGKGSLVALVALL